jgi:hypothetical protein
MREVIVEFPLEVLSQSGFPSALVRRDRSLKFLHLDVNGFQVSCKIPTSELSAFKKRFRGQYKALRIKRLHRNSEDGLQTLLIRGRWTMESVNRRDKRVKLLRLFAECQVYLLRSPEVVGEKFRVALGGEPLRIRQMLKEFDRLKVAYRIAELGTLPGNIGPSSPLDSLTTQQMRVLRLAHGMGYYDVPRRVGTKELSGLLKMDKGTTGEHIRRAEKHIMDHLLA